MILRSKKREEAIQLITMDPKVYGKLLTTHRRGYGVDVEALHGRFPLRWSTGEGSKMGSRGYRRLRWWKQFFMLASDVFGVHGYIQEEEVGQWKLEGTTRVAGTPTPRGHASHPRGRLGCCLTSTPCPVDCVCSKKDRSRRFHSVWTPFDIPFLRNTEIGKKIAIRVGPPVSRLVPKMI